MQLHINKQQFRFEYKFTYLYTIYFLKNSVFLEQIMHLQKHTGNKKYAKSAV